MRSFSRRMGASSVLAVILLAGSLAVAPPAAAVTYSTTVTQTAPDTLRAGNPQSVVATVTADGAPAPDGTLVHFSVTGLSGEFRVGPEDILTCAGILNAAAHGADGYWLADLSGVVKPYGSAPNLGDLPTKYGIFSWVVGIAPTPSGNGYWLATIDGKVYPFGDAPEGVTDYGLEEDYAVGIAPAAGGIGYRLATAIGRTLPAAAALGNTTGTAPLFDQAPVNNIVATPTGLGYWLYNHLGQLKAFGDAAFLGDPSARTLTHAITGMAAAPGGGYWMIDDAGAVYAYGPAQFLGAVGSAAAHEFFAVILATPTGKGYHLFSAMGAGHHFGDAQNYGSLWDVPTKAGKATFNYSSLAPGRTLVSALGPSSMGGGPLPNITTTWTPADGYWMLSADGAVYPFGGAVHLGDAKPHLAGHQAVDLEPTPDYGGYWIVDDIGRVFGFGNAKTPGNVDAGALRPGEKVTSLSSTPTGAGYWIFTSQGRVFAKGDATHFGDMAGTRLNGPVLDSIPTPTGRGYYMVGSDGGIFAFGDAEFAGSMGGRPLNAPVQSLVPDPDGAGYWLVASDGGIFAFDADFHGSMGATRLNKPVTGMVAFGDAYLMVGEDGGIFNFSDRPFYGSLGANPPPSPIVSVAILDPFGF